MSSWSSSQTILSCVFQILHLRINKHSCAPSLSGKLFPVFSYLKSGCPLRVLSSWVEFLILSHPMNSHMEHFPLLFIPLKHNWGERARQTILDTEIDDHFSSLLLFTNSPVWASPLRWAEGWQHISLKPFSMIGATFSSESLQVLWLLDKNNKANIHCTIPGPYHPVSSKSHSSLTEIDVPGPQPGCCEEAQSRSLTKPMCRTRHC